MTSTTYANQPHGPAQRLAELVAQYEPNDPQINRPGSLPVADIEAVPELFQPRGGMSEHHLGDLIRAIERVGTLEPIMVMPLGSRVILVDGHHRLEAYRRAGKPSRVPVVYFPGSPEEAVLAAGEANSKAKLPMTGSERQNHAWRLVLLDRHSKAKIAQASGVSVSQVGNMRKVMGKLGDAAYQHDAWWAARAAANGSPPEMSDEDREQWLEDQAEDIAARLAREFSTKLANNPEIAAMALERYFGRRLPEVVYELRHFISDMHDDEADDEF